MAVSKTDINPATGKQYAVNPATGNWDDNYWAQNEGRFNASAGGGGNNASSGGPNTTDVIANAQKLQEFYKKQNEPVVAATQATKAPLEQRYKDLIASIKGNQQVAENRQTVTTNNELGRRGITGSSGVAQQELTNAVNPITQQYTGMIKDTTGQENIDLANIDKAIASLMAGNPESAVNTSVGIGNAQQQASQFQQQLEATQKQNAIENSLKQLQATSGNSQDRYIPLGNGLYDTQTGQIIKSASATTTTNNGW